MRFSQQHLIFKALCVLQAWSYRAAIEPVKPDIGVRFALAFLFTCGKSGERRIYDEFWKLRGDPGFPTMHEERRRYIRKSYCNSCINGIMLDVGAPMTPEFSQAVDAAARRGSGQKVC